jgi:hypothetical protein
VAENSARGKVLVRHGPPARRYTDLVSYVGCRPSTSPEGTMATLRRPQLLTLGWQNWSVIVVVITILMLTLLIFH